MVVDEKGSVCLCASRLRTTPSVQAPTSLGEPRLSASGGRRSVSTAATTSAPPGWVVALGLGLWAPSSGPALRLTRLRAVWVALRALTALATLVGTWLYVLTS